MMADKETEYARMKRVLVANDIERLVAENTALREQLKTATEALEFYANPDHEDPSDCAYCEICDSSIFDEGDKARAALAAIKGSK